MDDKTLKSTNSLSKLRQLLTQDTAGMESYLYPKLTLGDTWWIPESVTGFSINREQHPWVIVNSYSPGVVSIIVCPRISTFGQKDLKRGIFTPANILPGLKRDGVFLLRHRRAIPITQFKDLDYIGKLPEDTLRQIKNFYLAIANGKIK